MNETLANSQSHETGEIVFGENAYKDGILAKVALRFDSVDAYSQKMLCSELTVPIARWPALILLHTLIYRGRCQHSQRVL